MKNKATAPVTPPSERIAERTFTHGGKTWVYNPDMICIEQAILAEEALQFKLELMQREVDTFNAVVDAGGTEWYSKCVGALLLQMVDGVVVPHTNMQWVAATEFVRSMPYSLMPSVKECLDDFFTSTGKSKGLSYVLNERSNMTSNRVVSALVKAMTTKHIG